MNTRTTSKSIAFNQPFRLSEVDGVQPAGTYRVDTDEDLIEGLSFMAYQRVATRIHLPVPAIGPHSVQVVTVDPREIAQGQD